VFSPTHYLSHPHHNIPITPTTPALYFSITMQFLKTIVVLVTATLVVAAPQPREYSHHVYCGVNKPDGGAFRNQRRRFQHRKHSLLR
jgi:hypothetical protein